MKHDYISAEEFDLMFEDELDDIDWDYDLEKDAMETSYQHCP